MGGEDCRCSQRRSSGSSRPTNCGSISRQPRVSDRAAHVATEEQYQTMRDAGTFDDDVVSGAADAILFERARLLLLGGAAPGESL